MFISSLTPFKEDWVKIGKSSRPVDIRSKELDNTAVPLPFEIYATLKVPYGIQLNAVIGYDYARMEVFFNTGDKLLNEKVFDYLHSKKSEIEKEYGGVFVWERLSDEITCRIKDEREYHCFDLEDKSELFEFLKDSSDKMLPIFHNHILDYKKENS